MASFVIITGLSGAGRSEAANHFEDLGWFVVDNLPPSMIPAMADLAATTSAHADGVQGLRYERTALVIGAGQYPEEIAEAIDALRSRGDLEVRVVFLGARTPVLVRRYETTRRRHPFAPDDSTSLSHAIEAEAEALSPVRANADIEIDTSDLNVHELRDRVLELFGGDRNDRLQTRVVSFGYKHGVPVDVDIVLDCRFLPNPHWVPALRPLTGRDQEVRDFVLDEPVAVEFLERMGSLLETLVPAYVTEGKSYLSIAVGCTGGRHRSVAVAERLQSVLGELGFPPTVTHRDLDRVI